MVLGLVSQIRKRAGIHIHRYFEKATPGHGSDKPRLSKIGFVRNLPKVHCNDVTVSRIN